MLLLHLLLPLLDQFDPRAVVGVEPMQVVTDGLPQKNLHLPTAPGRVSAVVIAGVHTYQGDPIKQTTNSC